MLAPMVNSHSICIVASDAGQVHWRLGIFEKIVHHISEGYAVVYVGEENQTKAIQEFSSMGISIGNYIEKGSLTIISRDVFYSPFVPGKILLEQWNKLFASIEKKAGKGAFRGFVAIGMPADSFFLSEADNQQLVRYESLAATKYHGTLEALCLYTTPMIEIMPLRYVISLLNSHQNTYHRDGKLRAWNTERGLSIIKRGLDSALGSNVTELVLPIIVRDFEFVADAMVLHPEKFERKLEILFGKSAANVVIDHIKREICKDVIY